MGGDDLPGLVSNEYAIAVRTMQTVESKRAPVKLRLNGWVDDGYYYEVSGLDAEGRYSSARTWFFKCREGHRTTIRLTVNEFAEGRGPDAAALVFLESVKETPGK